jgi:putative restriction endonuclease
MKVDLVIIKAAFQRVQELELLFGDTIPASEIRKGFQLNGETVLLENQVKGIFKPRQMDRGVLSIKTTMPRDGGLNIYSDQLQEDGYYHYSLQTGDPKTGSKQYLWQSK